MSLDPLTRRVFLANAAKRAVAASTLASLLSSCGSKGNPVQSIGSGTITLDLSQAQYAALNTVGNAMKVAAPGGGSYPLIVRRASQSTIEAFTSRCTHQGCEVGLPSGGVITCPCHGSTYDASGNLRSGPATSSLPKASVNFQGNQVTITL